jgi:hypothetical protein
VDSQDRRGRRSARGRGFDSRRPLQLVSAGQVLLPMGEGPLCNRACDQSRGPGSRPRLEKSPASETGWHGPRQRGTRDTLPLAIAGRLARRSRRRTNLLAGPTRARTHADKRVQRHRYSPELKPIPVRRTRAAESVCPYQSECGEVAGHRSARSARHSLRPAKHSQAVHIGGTVRGYQELLTAALAVYLCIAALGAHARFCRELRGCSSASLSPRDQDLPGLSPDLAHDHGLSAGLIR